MNWYAYAAGNPLRFVDPTGLWNEESKWYKPWTWFDKPSDDYVSLYETVKNENPHMGDIPLFDYLYGQSTGGQLFYDFMTDLDKVSAWLDEYPYLKLAISVGVVAAGNIRLGTPKTISAQSTSPQTQRILSNIEQTRAGNAASNFHIHAAREASFRAGLSNVSSRILHNISQSRLAREASNFGVHAAREASFRSGLNARNVGANLIKNDILGKIRVGSALKTDPYHAFNNIVDNYAGHAIVFKLESAAELYQLSGSLNGIHGRFEWITQGGNVTHRMFIQNGKIGGVPIKP